MRFTVGAKWWIKLLKIGAKKNTLFACGERGITKPLKKPAQPQSYISDAAQAGPAEQFSQCGGRPPDDGS